MSTNVVYERTEALLDQAAETGCVELSEIAALAELLELTDEECEYLYDEIERRGIELSDDCGREVTGSTYVNGELAVATTDALLLFLNEAARYLLLTADEEVSLASQAKGRFRRRRLRSACVRTRFGAPSRSSRSANRK